MGSAPDVIVFRAGQFEMQILNSGQVGGFVTESNGVRTAVSADRTTAPLLQLRVGGRFLQPKKATWDGRLLRLAFENHEADIRIQTKATHLTLELASVRPSKDVELAVWGPYSSRLTQSVGETVGVVQGQGFAFGLQVLNPKTLGGFPNTEDDVEPSYSIFDNQPENGGPVDLKQGDENKELYRGDTAKREGDHTVIQAYTRNRSEQREIANWAHDHFIAPPYKDGGVVGSKIALFACPSGKALDTLGQIEIDEGLPHPILDGVWAKQSPHATDSYLIMGFDTRNLDECLAVTKAAGLGYLYSDGCFETWGHFKLHPDGFPNNWESMRECVERAAKVGVRLGVHTLSNFITPNDAYVTPVPDKRLAEVGASTLAATLDETTTTVALTDPTFFNQMKNNTLKAVRIGDELIQYDSVSGTTLIKCKRGALGTKAMPHNKGARIAKLMDHGYGTFLTNTDLTKEVATNIARLFDTTGLRQLSFDGLEGAWSTGLGQYGRALLVDTWYRALDKETQGKVINDASNPGAWNWHINTRYNWGEPWYAGFRQSQTQYRLQNQHFFARNFIPPMLGWFQLGAETSLADVQWLLARAAGFGAGFCITTSLDAIHKNPESQEILAAIKTWETARHAGAFSPDLKPALQDVHAEFQLDQEGPKNWTLTQIGYQPGDVTNTTTTFALNRHREPFKHGKQRLILQLPKSAELTNWNFTLDGKPFLITEPKTWPAGHRVVIEMESWTPGFHQLNYRGDVKAINPLKAGEKPPALHFELQTPLNEFELSAP